MVHGEVPQTQTRSLVEDQPPPWAHSGEWALLGHVRSRHPGQPAIQPITRPHRPAHHPTPPSSPSSDPAVHLVFQPRCPAPSSSLPPPRMGLELPTAAGGQREEKVAEEEGRVSVSLSICLGG